MKEVKLVTAETESKKKKSSLFNICLIAGIIVIIAAVAVAIYKYLTPDYLDDFDEFDDDFDDDFFEDDQEIAEDVKPEVAEAAEASTAE